MSQKALFNQLLHAVKEKLGGKYSLDVSSSDNFLPLSSKSSLNIFLSFTIVISKVVVRIKIDKCYSGLVMKSWNIIGVGVSFGDIHVMVVHGPDN